MAKNVVLVGAGGFFLEVIEYIVSEIENEDLSGINIKGVIDDADVNSELLPVPYLGKISEYIIEQGDYFLICIGNATHRQNIFSILENKGANFYTYIHSSCYVSKSAKIRVGCLVCPNVIINAGANLQKNIAVNVFSSIGHGASIGSHSVLSPYSALNGDAKLGNVGFMGTRSTIYPGVEVGDFCIIDTHSYAKQNVVDKHIVSVRGEYNVILNRMIS